MHPPPLGQRWGLGRSGTEKALKPDGVRFGRSAKLNTSSVLSRYEIAARRQIRGRSCEDVRVHGLAIYRLAAAEASLRLKVPFRFHCAPNPRFG
jgi:hypothetical protein